MEALSTNILPVGRLFIYLGIKVSDHDLNVIFGASFTQPLQVFIKIVFVLFILVFCWCMCINDAYIKEGGFNSQAA